METVKSGESWKQRFAAIGNNSFLEPYYNFWEFASLQLFLLYSLFRLSLRNCFIMRGSIPHVTIPLLGIALGIWHLFRIQRPLFRTRAWKGNISPHPGTSTNLKYTCMCTKKGGNIIYTEHLIRAGLDFQGRVQILSALLVSGASRGVGVGGW